METERRDFPISHWNQLTKEQLEYVLTTSAENAEQSKVKIFLYLADLRFEKDNVAPNLPETDDVLDYGDYLDTVQGLLNGTLVCLADTKNEDVRFYCNPQDLAAWTDQALEWMENDHTLLSLPFETIKIGKHEYKMPDALLVNTKYQQYSNAQGYMVQYWNLLKRVMPPQSPKGDEGKEENEEFRNLGKEEMIAERKKALAKKKRKEKPWHAPNEKEMVEIAKQMLSARNGFLASMLTPYRWKVKPRYPFLFHEPSWDAESEKEMLRDMAHAPMWLFDALYKQWQDNIERFRKKFPDMFSEAKEDPKHDAFIAELGTINLVIEKGGYNNASAVYDENCVFVFKLLNDQIKEAKEMEKIQNKSKAKK